MAASGNARAAEDLEAPRDEVHFRARAFGPDARPLNLLVVSISALGLMARCDMPYKVGDRLTITLPVVGVVSAEIRWFLGGRIGCELDTAIELADYYDMLAVVLRGR
jgi:hypothetical protein